VATAEGLKSQVRIVRDRYGVPHIWAEDERDASFALGYAHAQDRLWQMESLRRAASGELSETAGQRTIPIDRFVRTLGLKSLAEAAYAELDPDVKGAVDAYTSGVNAFLDNHRGSWPPEFLLLGLTPRRWHPAESLMWSRLVAATAFSGTWRASLLRSNLSRILTPAELDQLWPAYPGDGPSTLAYDPGLYRDLPFEGLANLTETFDRSGGSNAWVVDGVHSNTGKPLLANDPHLGFSLPGLWYLVTIDAPHLHLAGATIPGVPFVILGHNSDIAWGMTATGGAVEDLFIEKLDSTDSTRYVTPSGSEQFASHSETIVVRGSTPTVILVQETRHGPVISNVVEEAGKATERGTVIALSATWLNPHNKVEQAFYYINRARTWSEFTAALKDFDAPQQNLLYADTAGHIGFYTAGKMPVRKRGDGQLPVPGWTGEYDWSGFIPFSSLPHALDSANGFYVNANNDVAPRAYPYFISRFWASPYRAKRIESLLSEHHRSSVDSFATMQADSLSLAAVDLLPHLTDLDSSDPDTKKILERMRSWNQYMDPDRPEPLVFNVWLRELSHVLLENKIGNRFHSVWNMDPDPIVSILKQHLEWCGKGASAANCRSRSAEALQRALVWIRVRYGNDPNRWRWGDAHQAQFHNPILNKVFLLGRFVDVVVPMGGSGDTINRTISNLNNEARPFGATAGASYRAIFDLADLSKSRFMIAVGESGNPFSQNFADLSEQWRDFKYIHLAVSPDNLKATDTRTLVVQPAATR
jgi:penicillin amidase